MHMNRFEVLAHVVEIANTSVEVEERLDSILGVINSHLKARFTTLFMQEQRDSRLIRANTWPPQALPSRPEMVEFGRGRIGEVAQQRIPRLLEIQPASGDPVLEAICRPGEKAALFPVMDDNRLYAVLVSVFSPQGGLESEDQRLMQMVTREMAGTIRNSRLYLEAKKRIAELNVLSDLGRAAISTIEVDQLLHTVADICGKLLGARGGMVQIEGTGAEPVRWRALYGAVPRFCLESLACGQDCPYLESGQDSFRVRRCLPDQRRRGFKDALCVKLSFKGSYQGRLCVFDKAIRERGKPGGFTPDDMNLLASMSTMVAAALENALTFQRIEDLAQRNEEMVGALATLFEISTVLMTTVDFEETVRIILYAVIHPAGLDHDRVLLFLLDESEQLLRPVADLAKPAVGSQLHELKQTLFEIKEQKDSRLTTPGPELARLQIKLRPEKSVLSRTVVEQRAIRVNDPDHDACVSPQFQEVVGNHPFVSVPMFAKGKVVGALLVNNYQSGRPFSDRDLKLLAMLANLGGLAVENSRLYQNLENANYELAQMRNRLLESDKLAALGEVAAGVAHEIRNPLVSIGGFTRRIRKKVGQDSPIIPYLDVIIDEVTRLERSLNEMLDFSTDARNHFEEHDLGAIMDQALGLLRREMQENRVEVVRHFAPGLPPVFCDDRQVKHVFLNLYLNAIQSMGPEGGRLTLRTFAVTREGKRFVAGEVTDSGGGIPLEVIHKIFNPFFTTKDSGSGLGLSIVHKIVTRHFGQVEVHNREGEGASFLVTLPAAEEGRAYLK